MVVYNTYDPAKQKGISIAICQNCGKHHFHVLKIGGVVYVQCGECKRITHNGDL